jgi:hypothetical protein
MGYILVHSFTKEFPSLSNVIFQYADVLVRLVPSHLSSPGTLPLAIYVPSYHDRRGAALACNRH